MFNEYLDIREQFGEQVHRGWRRRCPIHVAEQLRSAELPLCVRLRLDALVRVRHHGDEQVDQHDQRDDQITGEHDLDERYRPYRVAVDRRKTLRPDESEQREEEHLERVERRRDGRATAAVARAHGEVEHARGLHRAVDGGQLQREAEHEDAEDDEEADEVLHQVADDDGPRSEQVVEREEVQQLDETERQRQTEQLVADVETRHALVVRQQEGEHLDGRGDGAQDDDDHLDPAQTGAVLGVRQLRHDEPGQPGEQQPLVPVRHQVGRLPDRVDRVDGGEDEERNEVDVRHEVGHELDDGDLVEAVLERQRENDPDDRHEQHYDEEEHHLPAGPVRQLPRPHLRQVLLDGRVRHHLFLLALNQHILQSRSKLIMFDRELHCNTNVGLRVGVASCRAYQTMW